MKYTNDESRYWGQWHTLAGAITYILKNTKKDFTNTNTCT